jgi:hypothetical protein
LASAPAIKPRKIQERIPIVKGYRESRGDIKFKKKRDFWRRLKLAKFPRPGR